jgi:hypothetical protein
MSRARVGGRRVTPGGTKIGRVRGVVLDDKGSVTGLSPGQIAVEGPVAESKTIARSAVVDVGERDGKLTVDLAAAESKRVKIDPDSLTSGSYRAWEGASTVCSEQTRRRY